MPATPAYVTPCGCPYDQARISAVTAAARGACCDAWTPAVPHQRRHAAAERAERTEPPDGMRVLKCANQCATMRTRHAASLQLCACGQVQSVLHTLTCQGGSLTWAGMSSAPARHSMLSVPATDGTPELQLLRGRAQVDMPPLWGGAHCQSRSMRAVHPTPAPSIAVQTKKKFFQGTRSGQNRPTV